MMMDQEEHFEENDQPKFFTRSTARHLRRKRLHDARRAEKQQEYLTNSINFKCDLESITEKGIEQPDVITKSKARRLRKKNKAKLLQNCCSFCDSYVYVPVVGTAANHEVTAEKDTEDLKTVTKSKARRLRKKNKTKLVQNSCSFCYDTYFMIPPIDPIILKYIKTPDYDNKLEAEIANNLKQNCNPEKVVEAQVCHIEYDKGIEQLQARPESQENCSELSCLSRSPGLLKFGHDVQVYPEKRERNTQELVLTSELKQSIVETLQTKINCLKEDTRFQTLETKQFSELENSSDLQELAKLVNLVKLNQSIEFCNIECDNRNISEIDSVNVKSIENITPCFDIDLTRETGLQSFSDIGTQSGTVTTFSSNEELLENVKNLKFNDLFKVNLETPVQEDTKVSACNIEPINKCLNSIINENSESANPVNEQSNIELVSNCCSTIVQDCSSDSNSLQKEVEQKETEVSSVESSARLSNTTHLENPEPGSPVIQPSLKLPASATMTDTKANIPEKTREEIKAEREAKKAAKALAKAKGKTGKVPEKDVPNNKPTPPDSSKKKQSNETSERIPSENIQPEDKVINTTSNESIKNVPSEVNNEGKSKAELRAERRAKQEAQRAAKLQQSSDKSKSKPKENNKTKEDNNSARVMQAPIDGSAVSKAVTPKKSVPKETGHEINLFKHLYHEREQAFVDVPFVNSNLHPAIVRLGTQYANKVIVGSNARCVAFLTAVKQLIQDFERPSQADFIRGLEASLQESVTYLHYCRPLAVSMQNALRHLKWQMTQLPSMLSDADAKNKLSKAIDTYINEQIELADKAISITIQTKISNGDVILTYGYSSLINRILLDAHTAGKQFRVVVVDGRPWLEGKEQLRRLAKHGIECSYILINALSYVMPGVSKVFLGADAILANGAVMSRVGTAQVALMARAFNIPVLVACETHKSCERVQTDSIVYNELGNADELAQSCGSGSKKSWLANWRTKKSLNLLNITYDVTPADLVTAVVTELAILPCTSVPVILRIKPSEF